MIKNTFHFTLRLFFMLLVLMPSVVWSDFPPHFKDVAYGKNDFQKFDLWLAKSVEKTPVVIYFHGGGFTSGDKRENIPKQFAKKLLKSGISFVSANYRLVRKSSPFPAPHQDAARVVQFLRAKASEYNIDPAKIGVSGTSAGGNLALWVGLHSDLANPDSSDSIDRESSRVSCVLAFNAQTTLDPNWRNEHVVESSENYERVADVYDVSTKKLRNPSPALQRLMDEVSPITHASGDDPPLLLLYDQPMTELPLPPDSKWEVIVHHPILGVLLEKKMLEVKGDIVVHWAGDKKQEKEKRTRRPSEIDFILKNLNGIEKAAKKVDREQIHD
jgi:acetyl esterase